jgi:DNA-binding transcriptional regulator YhcF (GntR family)
MCISISTVQEDKVNQIEIQLSNASGVPFYRQIVDRIALSIRSGRLQPEMKLPSVRELAGRLLVSLITVRRSYADLEGAGLIIRRQGQGTFVAKEIEVATQEQTRAEARTLLADAMDHAIQLGLGEAELRIVINELLTQRGGKDGNA